MTAPMSDPATDAAIVEELAGALESQFSYATAHATVVLDWREEAEDLLPVVRRAQAEALREAVAAVRAVYDLQCPVMPADQYVGAGAHMAHRWWQTVLGGKLADLTARADAIEAGGGER